MALAPTVIPISFSTPKNYVLPDPITITSLISPSATNKYLAKKQNLFANQDDLNQFVSRVNAKKFPTYGFNEAAADDISTPPLSPDDTRNGVSFQSMEEDEDPDQVMTPSGSSSDEAVPPLDKFFVNCTEIPDDIKVALMNRDVEIRELMEFNKDFFNIVKATIHSEERWQEFSQILCSRRQDIPDQEWISALAKYLSDSPALLRKLKDIVGYNDDEYYEVIVDIALIRSHPEKLETFEESHQNFFENLQRSLTQEYKAQGQKRYEEFKQVFLSSRDTVPSDDEWRDKIYCVLEKWPKLVYQLEDIIAYEIEEA